MSDVWYILLAFMLQVMPFSKGSHILPCPSLPNRFFTPQNMLRPSFHLFFFGRLAIFIRKSHDSPVIIRFEVRTDSSTSSSTYVRGLLFKQISKSKTTSASSFQFKLDPRMTLYMDCFTNPISLSYWPPHQGALLRLNCHVMLFFAKRLFTSSLLEIFWILLAAASNVLALSE